MPIYLAERNQPMTIVQVTGNDKVRAHLANMGMVVGASIMLVNKVDDNVIVKVKGVSIAISNELAKRVLV